MTKQRTCRTSLLTLFAAALIAMPLAAESDSPAWGARAAALDSAPDIEDMLRYAIEDEYLARAEYLAIMGRFGAARPFSNIVKAEEAHIAWLAEIYATRGVSVPADKAASIVSVPASIRDALQAGIQAEIDNIAMYDSFLASAVVGLPGNATIRALFVRLRDASKNHLSAFRQALSRY